MYNFICPRAAQRGPNPASIALSTKRRTMKLTPGKLAGLKAVSNARNVIAAAAMDQRGSLQKSLATERGAEATGHDIEVFKTLVPEVLTKHATAILLDPEYGLPASKHRNGKGLLLAYEKTGYDATTAGRPPAPHGGEEKCPPHPKNKPHVVSGSMAEFGKARYNVDVLKVEVPIEMGFVEGTRSFKGERAYTRAEALQHFRDAESMSHKLFIYLSAGVSNPVFIETLELAGESGVKFNGVLCGRATWKDGIPIYAKQGPDAFRK